MRLRVYRRDAGVPDPADSSVHYVSEDPGPCMVILFGCEEGQTLFSDQCGCGCIDGL